MQENTRSRSDDLCDFFLPNCPRTTSEASSCISLLTLLCCGNIIFRRHSPTKTMRSGSPGFSSYPPPSLPALPARLANIGGCDSVVKLISWSAVTVYPLISLTYLGAVYLSCNCHEGRVIFRSECTCVALTTRLAYA